MANIKKEEKDAKIAVIAVRFTVAQKEKIEEEAKKNNMGVSGYIRAKAIQEGSPQVRRETNRICQLVKVEETLGELKRKMKTKSLGKIQRAINDLEREVTGLWRY